MSRVLVIDDDDYVRRTLVRYLEFDGFAVGEARDGADGLGYLREHPDTAVVVLDLRMPVMDGWSFRREQLLDPSLAEIPVIVLTGADRDRIDDLRAVAAFEKPVSMSTVAIVVRDLCAQAEER